MVFLRDVYSVVWLGKYDFTKQGAILVFLPQAGSFANWKNASHERTGALWRSSANNLRVRSGELHQSWHNGFLLLSYAQFELTDLE